MCLKEIEERNKRIKELTERLVDTSSFVVNRTDVSVEVNLEMGKLNIEKNNHTEFTQMVFTAEDETIYPCHEHDEYEYFMVLDGSISVFINKERMLLKQYDHLAIKPGTPHAVIFAGGSKVLVITIPKSTDY